MPQELQFESHIKKKFALLILTLITRHTGASTYLSLSQAIAYLAPHISYVNGRQPTLQVEELTLRLIDVCGFGPRDSGAQ